MAQPAALETYTRTISTMSTIIEELRDTPDPDGSITLLTDRIAVDREWARASWLSTKSRAGRPAGSRREGNALDSREPP